MADRGPESPATRGWDTGYQARFLDDLAHWIATDPRTALRLIELMQAVGRDPFGGTGKPEPLKYLGPNTWSRRLTREHRVLYRIDGGNIRFLQARHHY